MGVACRFEVARQAVLSRQFVSHTLVLNEAVIARGMDRLLVETQGIAVSLFQAGDLGQYQRVVVADALPGVPATLAGHRPTPSRKAPIPSARHNKSSPTLKPGRLKPRVTASPCRRPPVPRRSRSTGTALSI